MVNSNASTSLAMVNIFKEYVSGGGGGGGEVKSGAASVKGLDLMEGW